MDRKKMTPQEMKAKKERGEKIVRVVCYDYPMALLRDRAGVDGILVGDSVGMVHLMQHLLDLHPRGAPGLRHAMPRRRQRGRGAR